MQTAWPGALFYRFVAVGLKSRLEDSLWDMQHNPGKTKEEIIRLDI